jgi:hypothetical protein
MSPWPSGRSASPGAPNVEMLAEATLRSGFLERPQ